MIYQISFVFLFAENGQTLLYIMYYEEHFILQTWSSILDLRPRTVLLSFGTVARAHAMPEQYKQTIRETFRKFPNVTFIWKYEVSTCANPPDFLSFVRNR